MTTNDDCISPELRASIREASERYLGLLPEPPEEPPKYRGKMKPGEFEILAHGGGGYHQILEFRDCHPDLDFIEEEVSDLGHALDDLGWDGAEFEGLMVIRCRYGGIYHQTVDGDDFETFWHEQSRRPACWRVGTDWLMWAVLLSHVALWLALGAAFHRFW